MATGNAVTIRRSVTSATRIATASRTTRTMVVVRVPGPSATAVDVTSGSIGAARRAATVRWSGVDHDRALTGSTDARPDRRMSPAARALRDGAVLAGLLFLAYLFLVDRAGASARSASTPSPTGTSTRPTPYQVGVGALGAFNYSPPIARLFGPFGLLEWPSFLWIWTGAPASGT